jgi:hypothetical protein
MLLSGCYFVKIGPCYVGNYCVLVIFHLIFDVLLQCVHAIKMFGTQQYFVAPQIMQPTVMTTSLLKSNSITGYVKPYCSLPLQPPSCDGFGMMIRYVLLSLVVAE